MGSSKADIAVSYDVSNEFFRLWLDESMSYTCGIFDDSVKRAEMPPPGHAPEADGSAGGRAEAAGRSIGERTLEEAQREKHRILAGFAHLDSSKALLDIGCGWGANLEYQATVTRVKSAHGITLSEAQCAEIRRRGLPNVTAEVCSYLDFKPATKFDAIISICMMEHIVSPQEAREGKSIPAYRNYFRLAHEWAKPGAYFGLQTILRNFVPRDRKDVKDVGWVTYEIFRDHRRGQSVLGSARGEDAPARLHEDHLALARPPEKKRSSNPRAMGQQNIRGLRPLSVDLRARVREALSIIGPVFFEED